MLFADAGFSAQASWRLSTCFGSIAVTATSPRASRILRQWRPHSRCLGVFSPLWARLPCINEAGDGMRRYRPQHDGRQIHVPSVLGPE